jgi:hypothetical protein
MDSTAACKAPELMGGVVAFASGEQLADESLKPTMPSSSRLSSAFAVVSPSEANPVTSRVPVTMKLRATHRIGTPPEVAILKSLRLIAMAISKMSTTRFLPTRGRTGDWDATAMAVVVVVAIAVVEETDATTKLLRYTSKSQSRSTHLNISNNYKSDAHNNHETRKAPSTHKHHAMGIGPSEKRIPVTELYSNPPDQKIRSASRTWRRRHDIAVTILSRIPSAIEHEQGTLPRSTHPTHAAVLNGDTS